jgi:hypothetical protein
MEIKNSGNRNEDRESRAAGTEMKTENQGQLLLSMTEKQPPQVGLIFFIRLCHGLLFFHR